MTNLLDLPTELLSRIVELARLQDHAYRSRVGHIFGPRSNDWKVEWGATSLKSLAAVCTRLYVLAEPHQFKVGARLGASRGSRTGN